MKRDRIHIAVADDHILLRKGLVRLIDDEDLCVVLEADDGKQLLDQMAGRQIDVVLMDISMPVMNGMEATARIRELYPDTRVIALSMFMEESYVIRMISAGARGYVLKDSDPSDLKRAIRDVYEKGFHYSELVAGKLVHHLSDRAEDRKKITDREEEFLRLCCTELSYKEIAARMHVSPRTVDGYRDALFEKLDVHSRVGLALYAIRNKMVVV